MPSTPAPSAPLSLFTHPYRELRPVLGGYKQIKAEGRRPGSALVWRLGSGSVEASSANDNTQF